MKTLVNKIQIKTAKIQFVFDNIKADILSKLNPIVTKLFIGDRKLRISFAFIKNLILLFPKILD